MVFFLDKKLGAEQTSTQIWIRLAVDLETVINYDYTAYQQVHEKVICYNDKKNNEEGKTPTIFAFA